MALSIVVALFAARNEAKRRDTMVFISLLVFGCVFDFAYYYIKDTSSGIMFTTIAFLIYTFYMFAKSILNINKKIEDEQFKKELQQNNINISGVSDYCYNNLDEFKHKFIINYSAVSEENLKKALDVMNEALSE